MLFVLSPNCVVRMLSFLSVDDQGLESSSLWWNPRPTLHAGESSTVFGHVETESYIKDLNLIMKDCSALYYFLIFFISGGKGELQEKNNLCQALVFVDGFFFFLLFPGRSIL